MRRDGSYRLLEHTADARVSAEGRDFAEVASALLEALWELVYGEAVEGVPSAVEWISWRPASGNPALALVELLNEALYRLATSGRPAVGYRGGPAGGELGLAVVSPGVEPLREVKAATYSEALCRRRESGRWEAEITFDL